MPFVLESSHADFSLINSLACARASLLAYSDEATAIATANDWGFDCVKSLSRGPNYAIALCNRDDIVVAFRGTDAWNDWLTNLNILYKRSPIGAGFVHRGATSQDIVDTAAILAIRRATALIEERLKEAIDALIALADRHKNTVMAGRTHGQQASPITV